MKGESSLGLLVSLFSLVIALPLNLQAASFQGLGDLHVPGGDISGMGIGVSGDGSVAVGYSYSYTHMEAFRWTVSTGMVGLGTLEGGGI